MKNQIQKTFNFFIALLVVSSLITSCKKDDDNNSNPIPPSGVTLKTSVLGTVTNTDGLVVSGVTVKLGTYTTTTDTRGNFQFINADVPKDRMILVAIKDGYFKCVRAKRTQSGEANYVNLLMEEKPAAVNVSGAAGGVVNIPGGAKITFPTNAFVDAAGNAYTGNVKVFARHISPGDDNFEAIVPGGDLSGINLAGQAQSLFSLGMIEAILTDNTGLTEVKLASGKTAELKFPIDPSQTSSAQSTIPLWYMNETTGIWKEEGEAVKTGNFFVGNVTHFSTWNCDYSGERTDIQGKVVDCNNNPVPGIVVTINGFMNVSTDNTGAFTTWVPAGYVIDCQALMIYNPILSSDSPIQTITAVAGILNIIPPIIIPCQTRLVGTIQTCGGGSFSQSVIYSSWYGGNNLSYTSDGNYSMLIPPNTSVSIQANHNYFNGNTTVITGTIGSNTIAPVIQLCNPVNISETKFTVNESGGSTTFVVSIDTSVTSFVDNNFDGNYESIIIYLTGIANPGNYTCGININLSNSIDGLYPLNIGNSNSISVSLASGSGNYQNQIITGTTLNRLMFTDYGSPGGVTAGDFEYDFNTGTITGGKFSVRRDN